VTMKMLGVPELPAPKYISAPEATFLTDDDEVYGLVLNGKARAYPHNILTYHFIVHDKIEDAAIVLVHNGFSGTTRAYVTTIDGEDVAFNYSGRLYRSNFVLYDAKTGSLWDSLDGLALTGPSAGKKLKSAKLLRVRWGWWKKENPDTTVLSRETGAEDFPRVLNCSYSEDLLAKARYTTADIIVCTVPYYHPETTPIPAKAVVFGIRTPAGNRAYERSRIFAVQDLKDKIGDYEVTITWNDEMGQPEFSGPDGKPIEYNQMYWFAWRACNMQTDVYTPPPQEESGSEAAPSEAPESATDKAGE